MVESPKRGLLAAYGRLLGPLFRILIRNGVSYEEFAQAAKEIFVDVAETDFKVSEEESRLARIAILAGVGIEEVKSIQTLENRIRKSGLDSDLNHVAVVLSGWHTDSDFTGPYGVPIELKLEDTRTQDFKELVRRHAPQGNPERLLDELKAVGAVVETDQGWFKVLTRFYLPQGSAPAGMDHLSRSVEDFVETLDHNALETDTKLKMFERQTYTADGIRAEDLPRFTEFATSRAKILLEEIDNWLSQLDEPTEPANERTITGLGIYHYIHNDPSKKIAKKQ
jgi:hypothetical protein